MLTGHVKVDRSSVRIASLVAHRILHLLERVDHRVELASVRVEQAIGVEAGVGGPICSVGDAETTEAAVGVSVLNDGI